MKKLIVKMIGVIVLFFIMLAIVMRSRYGVSVFNFIWNYYYQIYFISLIVITGLGVWIAKRKKLNVKKWAILCLIFHFWTFLVLLFLES